MRGEWRDRPVSFIMSVDLFNNRWHYLMSELTTLILNFNLFSNFDFEEVAIISQYLSCYKFQDRQLLMKKGEIGNDLGIVLSGDVHIIDGEVLIATRKPGEIVGEMALIRSSARMADVVAASTGEIAVMSFTNIERIKNEHPRIAVKLIVLLTESTLRKLQDTEKALQVERERLEFLLENIFPKSIVARLKQGQDLIAENFDEVTILFADIVGFTRLAQQLQPIDLVNLLNEIFSIFDLLTEKYGLEKIKTIGDAYMVVGGLPVPTDNHAEAVAEMAMEMQAAMSRFESRLAHPLQLRIGINTGEAIAGVIGMKKFTYDLWGDAVNVASRMEFLGIPGKIQVTDITYDRLKDKYLFEERGRIAVKGKGDMTTYWLIGKKGNNFR